ncbi:hypothetical protein C8A03DRAFT_19152 [Achaetomium macrosporum]|uniref:Cell cycle control protein n=1 Tax=Achaetomium macrosporum TaxID=79813 RepID=A0AAN7C1X6_9PEZI|nr:hypothetical protein C8A03DRAFT_19152 [Achaetomium macrosporum]
MDLHEAINLEDLPSDAFDLGDFEQPQSVSDYSSWPAVSSPASWEHQEEDDIEYSEDEIDEDYEEHYEEDEEASADGEAVYNDDGEDEEFDEDAFADEGVDDGGLLPLADPYFWDEEGFPDQGSEGGRQRSPSLSPIPGFAAFLAELQAHQNADRLSEAPSDSLFVDDGPDFLPPIDSILSSVRRTMSEIQQGHRNQRFRSIEQSWSSENSLGRGALGRSRESNRWEHRHHPHNMPRETARGRARMADQGNHRNDRHARDELVAMEVHPVRSGMPRRRAPPQPEVIDLTGEPDSPVQTRAPEPPQARVSNASNVPQNSGRNPRRQLSLSQRTPSLSRSDASLIGNNPNFIDLTGDDSPAPPPLPQQLPSRRDWNHHDHRAHHHPPRRQPPASSRPQPIDLENDNDLRRGFAGFMRRAQNISVLQRLLPEYGLDVLHIGAHGLDMDNPLAGNIPNLNYRANGSMAGGVPKPPHEPPPPAREGFTRNTGGDTVVICPSCEKELKYDPDSGAEDASSPRPNKKARTKKDQEEHYFWALKDCGHVYCKECYESRGRKTSPKTSHAHFRRVGENNRKVLCAVEGCPTEANNKLNWVGLFL